MSRWNIATRHHAHTEAASRVDVGFPTGSNRIIERSSSGTTRCWGSGRWSRQDKATSRDWDYGVAADHGQQGRIENIRAFNNKWDGIRGGPESTITDSASATNGADGIVSFGGTVQHSEVDNNKKAGIFVTDNSVVKDNSVHNGLGDGIDVQNSADVEGNSVIGSAGHGIASTGGADMIKDNLVEASVQSGIRVVSDSNVEGNTVLGNNTGLNFALAGILVTGDGNTITGNAVTQNLNDIFLTSTTHFNVVTENRTTVFVQDGGASNGIGHSVDLPNIATNTFADANLCNC